MATFNIGCIVEGDGDEPAVRILLRRMGQAIDPAAFLNVVSIVRRSKDKLVRPGELERCIELVIRCDKPIDALFVVIDADKDCPAELGPRLLSRAVSARADVPVGLVIAKCEFEAWFLASLADDDTGRDPEEIRGAKQHLSERLGLRYVETRHQAAYTETLLDLERARRADSFDKCWREVASLLDRLRPGRLTGLPAARL